MLNQVIIAGRLTKDPQIRELENGKKETIITVAVPRSYKNAEGTYDTDFITCVLWNGIATTTTEYCKTGDIVGIKGRLQKENHGNLRVIAEKVSFLSSKREEN